MGIFDRVRSFFGRVTDKIAESTSDFIGLFRGERSKSETDNDTPIDDVSDAAPRAHDAEYEETDAETVSGDDAILPASVPADDDDDGGLIWDFDASLMGELSEGGDGKRYIEADYTILLKDGEEIDGGIKFYGEEKELIHAIIAKHGELKSDDIANVSVHSAYFA